jgi:hypothetical protein
MPRGGGGTGVAMGSHMNHADEAETQVALDGILPTRVELPPFQPVTGTYHPPRHRPGSPLITIEPWPLPGPPPPPRGQITRSAPPPLPPVTIYGPRPALSGGRLEMALMYTSVSLAVFIGTVAALY